MGNVTWDVLFILSYTFQAFVVIGSFENQPKSKQLLKAKLIKVEQSNSFDPRSFYSVPNVN